MDITLSCIHILFIIYKKYKAMKNLKDYIMESDICEAKQISAKTFTSQEALDLIKRIDEPQRYVKDIMQKMDKEQFARQKDPKYNDYNEFDKLIKELEAKYKDDKFKKYETELNDLFKEIESGMTAAEIKKLPKRGGYRFNLTKAFLNKYTTDKY